MFETALDAIVTMDHLGRIVDFNPAAEKTFGYTRQEVVGLAIAELIIPASLREKHRRGLAHYLATGEGPVMDRRIEIVALRKDGSEFPIELAITRVPKEGDPFFTGAEVKATGLCQFKKLSDCEVFPLAVSEVFRL